MSAAFLCRYTRDVVIAPGGSETVDVPIDGARDSTTVLRVSGGDLDTATVARSPLGSLFEDAEALTGTPVAASGASVTVESSTPITTLRLVLGSTGGCTVAVEAGGW